MTEIQLTEEQQKDLINALSAVTFGPVHRSSIALTRYEFNAEVTTVHQLEIDFYLTTRSNNHSFQLVIGHFDTKSQKNPESIWLLSINEDKSYEFMPLAGLGYVTNKLREYSIW